MIVRVATLLVILLAIAVAVGCFGFARGQSRADDLMRRVDGSWKRTQTRFAVPAWQFYYEAQDEDYRRSAPVMISSGLLGNLPRRLTISFTKGSRPVRLSSNAIPVSRDEAYSLSSTFWNQSYTFSLQKTRPDKP